TPLSDRHRRAVRRGDADRRRAADDHVADRPRHAGRVGAEDVRLLVREPRLIDEPQPVARPFHDRHWAQEYAGLSARSQRSSGMNWPLAVIALFVALPFGMPTPATPQWKPVGPAPLRIPAALQPGEGPGPNSGEVTGIAIGPSGDRDQRIFVA